MNNNHQEMYQNYSLYDMQNLSSSSSSEQQHFEVIFINNKKYFSCLHPDCAKTFKFYSEIKRHLLIHCHERPFMCTHPNCQKSFKRADALNNHIRTHSKITPFQCPVDGCDYKSTTKSALRYHMLRHNGEKIFTCNYDGCNRTFLTCSQLRQHERTNFCHQYEAVPSVSVEDYDDDLADVTVDGQIYYLEKITLEPKQKLSPQDVNENYSFETQSHSTLTTFKEDTSEQVFSDDMFDGFPQTLFGEISGSTSPLSLKLENSSTKTVQENYPPINLEFKLGQAAQENINLKQTLQNALDLLQIYKQKEKIGVYMFLRPSSEVDQEQQREEFLWTTLYDQLKHSSIKI